MKLLYVLLVATLSYDLSTAQIVALKEVQACSGTSDGPELMGRPGGLTFVLQAGCPATAWGINPNEDIVFDFNNGTSTNWTYQPCLSNLKLGKAYFTATDALRYQKTNGSWVNDNSVDLRLIIDFGTSCKRNGDTFFRELNTSFTCNITIEANVASLSSPHWTNGNSQSGWTPALTLFDELATDLNWENRVISTCNDKFFKVGDYNDVFSNFNVSCVNCGSTEFGREAGESGGVEYDYTNNSGATAYFGFDAATSFQLRFEGSFNNDGVVPGYTSGTIAQGQDIVFEMCGIPWDHLNTSGVVVNNDDVDARIVVRFLSGAASVQWKDGYILAQVNNNQTLRVRYTTQINMSTVNGGALGHGATTGWEPLRDVYDGAHVYGQSYYTSVTPVYYNAANVNYGNTVTWTGNIDNKWEDPCNWDCRVPTWDDEVIIPAAPANWPRVDPSVADMSPDNDQGAGTNNAQVKNITIHGSSERLRINYGDLEIQD